MEQYLIEQYLARIGYVSGPGQQTPEQDSNSRADNRLATNQEVQAKIPTQLKEQYTTQEQAPATFIPESPKQTDRQVLCEETPPLSIRPDTSCPNSMPGTEAGYLPSVPQHKHKFPPKSPSPPHPTKAELLTGLHSELERRQNICLGIEHQLQTCQKELHTLQTKQKKIKKQHEKGIATFENAVHNGKKISVDAQGRRDTQTAAEAEIEEMRNIYQQYDRKLVGRPNAGSVDALFVIIANTEHRLKNSEEANKAANMREVRLEEELYKARCAMFEVEDEIEEAKNGVKETEAMEPNVKERRAEGHKAGKRKPRRRKEARDGQQREEGDKRVRRRRKRQKKISSNVTKMSSNVACDS